LIGFFAEREEIKKDSRQWGGGAGGGKKKVVIRLCAFNTFQEDIFFL